MAVKPSSRRSLELYNHCPTAIADVNNFLGRYRHAGYSYSGPAAAWAYKSIDTSNMFVHFVFPCLRNVWVDEGFSKRIFILGPSHHYYLQGCALSKCTEYETPVGNLPIDVKSKSWNIFHPIKIFISKKF